MSKKGDSIGTTSIRNRDLETPETHNLIIQEGRAVSRSGQEGHIQEPQSHQVQRRAQIPAGLQPSTPEHLYSSVENNYAVAQVKSLLDQQHFHDSTTLDKNEPDIHSNSMEDLINQGSVQHVIPGESAIDRTVPTSQQAKHDSQEGGTSTANSYIQELLGRVEDANPEEQLPAKES